MRILDVTEFYSERGGVRCHLDLKGQILRQAGHHHLIVAPGPADGVEDLPPGLARNVQGKAPEEETGSARALRVAGPTLPYDGNYHLLWRIDKVRRIALDEAPDVLEINSPYLAPLCIPGERRRGGVTTFWWHADFIDSYARTLVSRFASDRASERLVRPLWALVRKISNKCDATFAAGRQQADKLMEHGVRRVRYLPFGIDKETFRPDARSDAWRALTRGDRANVPILVAVGRLSVEKQWHVVLDGFMRAFGRGRALLLVFGDGPERDRLEADFGNR